MQDIKEPLDPIMSESDAIELPHVQYQSTETAKGAVLHIKTGPTK